MTSPGPQPCCDAQTERDQYAAAARHLAFRIRHTAYVWATTLPETIRTADVVEALSGIASHVPDRPELRDDLWMRIAGAYEARFENDGHPEDAQHAADEAMSVVQPVLDEFRAAREDAEETLAKLRDEVASMCNCCATNRTYLNCMRELLGMRCLEDEILGPDDQEGK